MQNFTKRLYSQQGQGIVEYILLLVAILMLAGGVLYKFNTAFNTYLSKYFGEDGYIACLIEVGELPDLGSNQSSGICSKDSFKFSEGKTLSESRGGRNPRNSRERNSNSEEESNQPGSEKGSNSTKKIKSRTASRNKNKRFRPSSSNGKGSGGAGSGSSSIRSFSSTNNGSAIDEDAEKSGGGGNSFQVGKGYEYSKGARNTERTQRFIPLMGKRKQSYAKGEEEKEKKIKKTNKKKELLEKKQSKKSLRIAIKPIKQSTEISSRDEDWGLGHFLRYIIIAIILIALIVIVGSQIYNAKQQQE